MGLDRISQKSATRQFLFYLELLKKISYSERENMSLLEIIKKLRLIDIKNHFRDCFKFNFHPTKIKIDQIIVNDALNNITLKQFEEVKNIALETAEEISKIKKEVSELPQRFKEAIAKAIVAETILINLSTLRQKISKGLIKIDSNMAASLLIRCEKCGKFFNSGIGGNLPALVSTTFINNSHQCQHCGNMQLAKDNSDYFVSVQ